MSMFAKVSIAKFEAENMMQKPNFVLIHPMDVARLLEEIELRIPLYPADCGVNEIDGMTIIKAEIPALLGNPKAVEIREPKEKG